MSSTKSLISTQHTTVRELNESFSDLSDFADLSGSLSSSLHTGSFSSSTGFSSGHFGSVSGSVLDISQSKDKFTAQNILRSVPQLKSYTQLDYSLVQPKSLQHNSKLLSGYFGKSSINTDRFLSRGQPLGTSLPLNWTLPPPSLNYFQSSNPNSSSGTKMSYISTLDRSLGKTVGVPSGQYRRSSDPDFGSRSLDANLVQRVEDIVNTISKMTSSVPITSSNSLMSSGEFNASNSNTFITSSANISLSRPVTSSKLAASASSGHSRPKSGYKLSKSRSVDSAMDKQNERSDPGNHLQRKLSSTFKKHYLKTVVVADQKNKGSDIQKETVKNTPVRIEHKVISKTDHDQIADNTQESKNKTAVKNINSNVKNVKTEQIHSARDEVDSSGITQQNCKNDHVQTEQNNTKAVSKKSSVKVARKIGKFMSLLGTFKDLQQQHEHALSDITKRFENIKMTLSEKVDHLRAESEAMRRREREYLASYKADSDMKVQLAVQPFKHLPQEIESLKAVLEMRNQEIHELRRKNLEFEKQLEELPKAKEKINHLEQKNENLEAVIKIKADYERQLSEKHSVLLRRYDKEAKANKRLSMDKEELEWRLSQDSTGLAELLNRSISHSPPSSTSSTPEPTRRRKSPLPQQSPRSPRGGIAMEFFENKSPRSSRSAFDSPRANGTNTHHRKQVKSGDFDRPALSARHSSADLYASRRDTALANNVFEEQSQDDSLMSASTHSEPSKPASPVKSNLKRSGTYDLLNEEFELCEEKPCNNMKQTDV